MNPFMSKELATEHIRDLHEAARGARNPEATPDRTDDVLVRRFAERDIDAIRRLAALDSKPEPSGGVLVAERAGEIVAALPLDGGGALADPFKRTADAVALLKRRAPEFRPQASPRFARFGRVHLPRGRFAA